MKLKERFKNVGFWVSITSSIVIMLGAFGVEIADETASSVINAVCSALVMLGIISDPTVGKGYLDAVKTALGTQKTEIGKAEAAETASVEVAVDSRKTADAEIAIARAERAEQSKINE